MVTIDSFVPTRIVFGAGRLAELVSVDLPGKRALICTTKSARAEHLSLIENVVKMLAPFETATSCALTAAFRR